MDYFCCFFSVPLASLGHWESKESFEKMWRERGRLLKWQKCLAFLGKNLKLWMGDRSRFWGLCGFIILNSKRWNDFVCWKKKIYIYIYILIQDFKKKTWSSGSSDGWWWGLLFKNDYLWLLACTALSIFGLNNFL